MTHRTPALFVLVTCIGCVSPAASSEVPPPAGVPQRSPAPPLETRERVMVGDQPIDYVTRGGLRVGAAWLDDGVLVTVANGTPNTVTFDPGLVTAVAVTRKGERREQRAYTAAEWEQVFLRGWANDGRAARGWKAASQGDGGTITLVRSADRQAKGSPVPASSLEAVERPLVVDESALTVPGRAEPPDPSPQRRRACEKSLADLVPAGPIPPATSRTGLVHLPDEERAVRMTLVVPLGAETFAFELARR